VLGRTLFWKGDLSGALVSHQRAAEGVGGDSPSVTSSWHAW